MNNLAPNTLEIGTTGRGEIVINHPDIDADKDGVGHIVFSIEQALAFADIFVRKIAAAKTEIAPRDDGREIAYCVTELVL